MAPDESCPEASVQTNDANTMAESASPILTPTGLASRWGVTVKHLANMRCEKVGPSYVKLGGIVRYRLGDVETYETRNVVKIPV